MTRAKPEPVRRLRCAIYIREASEEGRDMGFSSLEAIIDHETWDQHA